MTPKIIITGIGADCEVFLQHRATGEIISAEGFINGSKDDPFLFDPKNKYYSTQLDNVLAEFTIPPAKTKLQFLNALNKGLDYINKSIPGHLCTIATPCARLAEEYLQTEQAKKFGCEPDFNAYKMAVNIFPKVADKQLRSAGAHIHIGYEGAEAYDAKDYTPDQQRARIIRAADLHVAIPLVIAEPDNDRKLLYGKAGAYRPKPYGVEYRTPSNFYLQSPKRTLWIYEAIHNAVNWLNEGNIIEPALGDFIAATINNNNKADAEMLINTFNLKAA